MRKFLTLLTILMLSGAFVFAQNKTITGKVTDDNGAPLSDVSVMVKGTKIGTVTNAQGEFSFQAPATAKVLVFSSVGKESTEVTIGNRTNVSAVLKSSDQTMDEVVINIPYGTIKKTSFTGSENTVSTKTLEKQQVTNVTSALEGLIPGIITTNGGGTPGSGAGILVRGVGSVNASSAPLYVLNGVPYDGSISAISMDDIESVSVLKDATASALYGSRAANGVIMITTKKGKRGSPSVGVTLRQGYMSRGIPEYDRVDSKSYYELMWEGYRNSYFSSGNSIAASGVLASNVLTGASGLVY
ncbi:MAG: TonB-dependent receptor plug domain-containing protein, partial [Ginsengibacter sp.]